MIAYNVVGVGRFQSVVPAKEVVKDTDLILRSLRSKRLEGWTQRADSRPSFETRAPDSASALPGGRAPQDEVGDTFTACEKRPLGRVSKDGPRVCAFVHPSRRLLRKLLRMRSVSFTGSNAGRTRGAEVARGVGFNAPRTPSGFAPARPSPVICPPRRGPAGR